MAQVEVTYQTVPDGPYLTIVIPAASIEDAEEQVAKQGAACIISRVIGAPHDPHPGVKKAVGAKWLLFMYRDMEINSRLGMPLLTVLNKAARSNAKNKVFAQVINSIEEDIRVNGSNMVSSMARFPRTFDEVCRGLLEASSRGGGNIALGLKRIYNITRRNYMIRKKIKGMMIYPAVIMVLATCVAVYMCITFVPIVTDFYGSFHAKLPPATQNLVEVFNFSKAHGIVTVVGVVIVLFLMSKVPGLLMAQPRFHPYIMRMPILGPFMRTLLQTNFARTYTQLSTVSVALPTKLRLCRNLSKFYPYRAALAWASIRAQQGEPFYDSLDKYGWIFDTRVVESLRSGEEGGSSSEIMDAVVEVKEEELDAAVDTLGKVGPIVALAFAVMPVGFVMMAVFQALFGLSEAVN